MLRIDLRTTLWIVTPHVDQHTTTCAYYNTSSLTHIYIQCVYCYVLKIISGVNLMVFFGKLS